ncbi:hypothetical protein [Cohnella cellulosilytica]|uniref:Glycosyl transferase family 2 n=1 Tax=Cohnella cellulosilytica TaxID=986710 RepID=A0ABW2FJI6_9BACL
MLPELFWIVGLYVAAMALAHWLIRRSAGAGRRHYVLVAGNHQMQIEGYIRAIQHFSRRTGTEIGITVVLDRSTDETGPILERMARKNVGIEWVRRDLPDNGGRKDERVCGRGEELVGSVAADPSVVWVELARPEDVKRLPR